MDTRRDRVSRTATNASTGQDWPVRSDAWIAERRGKITKYCGVVAGEAILGANVFKDLFAGIRDLVGGRSATYERELQRARDIAIEGERGELANGVR